MSTPAPTTDLASVIALPTLIGEHVAPDVWGHAYQVDPFLELIEERVVDALLDPEDRFLIVNLPPQCGKTSLAALTIFWYIGMHPDKQVIFVAYSDDYARQWGALVRDLFKAFGRRLFGVEVDPQRDSAADWALLGHPAGGMLSVGIGSQITGRSGHLVWIDDVIKNMEEAGSAATKKKHLTELDGTILSRRQPGCTYVISATRFADDDVSGSVQLRQQRPGYLGDIWEVLSFPAICEPPEDWEGAADDYVDALGRTPGDPLVCRFVKDGADPLANHFTKVRNTIDAFVWACLYQQNPVSTVDGMFPKDRWQKAARDDWPELYTKVRAWDVASTSGGGDYTVGALLGRAANGDIYVIERYREQRGPEDVINDMSEIAERDGFGVPILIEQERSGAGATNLEFYKRHLTGYTVTGAKAEGTKEQRARPYSVLQRGRHVWLPSDEGDQRWVEEWVAEHKGMMGDGRLPKHDDQIDTAAYAVKWLLENNIVEIADPNDMEVSWEQQRDYERYLEMMGIYAA